MRAAVAPPAPHPCCASSSSPPHPIGAAARSLPLAPHPRPPLPPQARAHGRLALPALPSDAVEVGQVDAGGGGAAATLTDARSLAAAADRAGTATSSTAAIIADLRSAATAIPDRGVYGTKTPAKDRVLAAVAAAEALVASEAAAAAALPGSPCVCAATGAWAPTAALPALAGSWTVLWSTVTCTGSRRVKLGLRTAVSLKGVAQTISQGEGGGGGAPHPSPITGTATNTVSFSLLFMGGAVGALTLEAAYEALSPTRVGIRLTRAALAPPALDALFGPARLPLLLEIFNPEGWLDTTFVGGGLRVGRDDKGHVFVLERVSE